MSISSLRPTRVVSVDLSNFYGPMADTYAASSSETILHDVQRTFAELHTRLKRSGSVDFSKFESAEVQDDVIPDLVDREESYKFTDDRLFDEIMDGGRDIPSPSTLPAHSDCDSSGEYAHEDFENDKPEDKRVRYNRYIAHMRRYFASKGVHDVLQQNRILFSMLQGLGRWAFDVPQAYLGMTMKLTQETVRLANSRQELSLEVDPKGTGDAYVTLRMPMEYNTDPRTSIVVECASMETTLCIPKDPNAEIRLIKSPLRMQHPDLAETLGQKLRLLQEQLPRSVPRLKSPLPLHILQKAHQTPMSSMSTKPFGYQSFGERAKKWMLRNWVPVATGAAVVLGTALLATFVLSGGGALLSLLLLAGVGFVVTEVEVTILLAALLVATYAATMAISYKFTKKIEQEELKPNILPEQHFTFEPPMPQLITEAENKVEVVEKPEIKPTKQLSNACEPNPEDIEAEDYPLMSARN